MAEAVHTSAREAQPELTGVRRAAILLLVLGEKAAGEVFRHLPPADVERLTKEISEIDYVSQETADQVLADYQKLAESQSRVLRGGPQYAERLLVKAFGEVGSKRLLEQAIPPGAAGTEVDALRRSDPQQLAKFIQGEQPQTIALLLAHLGVKSATALLSLLPIETRTAVVERLARTRHLSAEMVQKISWVLRRKLEAMGTPEERHAFGGLNAVADILNQMSPENSKAILESIEQSNPELALAIRNVLFTFEDLLTVPESGLRELLKRVDKKTLAVALKGASPDLRGHIFKTMSSRAAEMLKEDMDVLGPMRAREVAQAQQEIVAVARQMEAEGQLSLRSEGEDAYVV